MPTTWYNYGIASAGTILGTSNNTYATESICPKGWTLPTIVQVNSNRSTSNFAPVLGGYYNNTSLRDASMRGIWWGSEAWNSARRYYLDYYNNNLSTGNGGRRDIGLYIRCVPAP